MAGWIKALLFLLGGVVAAGGTAYVTGLLDPWLAPPPAVTAPAPEAETSKPQATAPQPPAEDDAGEADEAADEAQPDGEPVTTAKQDRLVAPVFDVLRVEPDGSLLVAGKAGAGTQVEVLSGDAVLGTATAGEGGDFVIVLDDPLAPGDYRLALRAAPQGEGEAALSAGTAIVSIPETRDGQVLAMIEEPGAPAQLITVPQAGQDEPPAITSPDETAAGEPVGQETAQDEPATPQAMAEAQPHEPAAQAALPGEETPPLPEADADAPQAGEPAPVAEAAASGDSEPGIAAEAQPAATSAVVVEAVEIEGGTIFVAGRAEPGRTVRVYADATLLGDAVVSQGGRFLIEAQRDLAVGNYMIRADLIGEDGAVLARAAVPFEREPGETIAAVAPDTPSAQVPPTAAAPAADTEAGQREEVSAGAPASAAGEGADAGTEAGDAAAVIVPETPLAGEEAATAAPLQRVDGAVIIRRGDSLWRISRRVYGHGIRYSTIYLANQDQIRNPDLIWPGQVFTLPHETPEGEQADLQAIGDQAVSPQDRDPDAEAE